MSKRVCALLIALAMLLVCACSAAASEKMITRCNVIMRKSASTTGAAITTLKGGTEVTVLGKSGSWTRVQYSSYKGYVYTQYLMTAGAEGYYTLREGDENAYVLEMQRRLVALNYLTVATGEFDSATTAAVKAFQRANGLKVDGLAGAGTQKALYADSAVSGSGTASSTQTTGSGTTSGTTGSTTTDYTLLKEGMESYEVKNLQQRLIDLGYLTGSATGYYGTATKGAVKDFQTKNGLKSDGLAGSVTQALLYSTAALSAGGQTAGSATVTPSATAAPSGTKYTLLKKGVTSSAVKTLQEQLILLGYLKTNATGYYGSATYSAVKAFQQANGLKADGIAGTETQTKLFSTSTTVNPTAYTTLKLGTKSSDVTSLQKRLIELGYMTGSATGYYGDVTYAAVKAFQKANGLSADGVAGKATQQKLYGSSAVVSSGSSTGSTGSSSTVTAGKMTVPAASKVKLLHWQNVVKAKISNGDILLVCDPETGYCWNLRAYSRGRHLDAEPLTADDTKYMNAAFGGVTTWTPKCVYVQLTDGTWVFATMHNTPHLSGSISNNNFDGHLCVHFLRDMSEAQANDPNYGVTHQKAIREGWKKLTGETVN